ncbi:MAG TPA: tRNA-binding protein [archaeon]|nr:tRNA-binding protein [archaeon]
MTINYADFEKVEFRVGKILEVHDFPEAKNPSYKLKIDFGKEMGVKKSCAQATNYSKEELIGRQVICVVNFPPKQIGNTVSEVLVTGVQTEKKGISLLKPDKEAILGTKIF